MLALENLGGVIHMKHCSSWYYTLKLLFIVALSLKTLTLFIIFILFKPSLFIFRTRASFFPLYEFLPMKRRSWRPMSYAKYRMEHNHVIELCYEETMLCMYVNHKCFLVSACTTIHLESNIFEVQ